MGYDDFRWKMQMLLLIQYIEHTVMLFTFTSNMSYILVYLYFVYRQLNFQFIIIVLLFSCSLGPLETLPREMVSRRKILSRSRDDLNLEQQYLQQQEDEEDIWYMRDKLYKVSGRLLYGCGYKRIFCGIPCLGEEMIFVFCFKRIS